LEKLASVETGQAKIKSLLAEAPSPPIRRGMIQRRKTGFNVPIAKWISRQQQSAMSEWKRVPLLRSPRCHWSRRWAYSVACGA
jgi:asparagine synthase (glutamine-hydrolysing)